MPHADDAPCGTTGRPCEDDEPSVEPPGGDKARLTVVLAIIYAGEVRPGKCFLRAKHVQAAFVQGPLALGWVTCDSHGIIVSTEKESVKRDGLPLLANT
jgi:hypothetical protein